jgi:hypothetical protein
LIALDFNGPACNIDVDEGEGRRLRITGFIWLERRARDCCRFRVERWDTVFA